MNYFGRNSSDPVCLSIQAHRGRNIFLFLQLLTVSYLSCWLLLRITKHTSTVYTWLPAERGNPNHLWHPTCFCFLSLDVCSFQGGVMGPEPPGRMSYWWPLLETQGPKWKKKKVAKETVTRNKHSLWFPSSRDSRQADSNPFLFCFVSV